MASSFDNNYSQPPPAYFSLFNEKSTQEELTFVDFYPEYAKPSGAFTRPVYKDFKSVVDRANNWLRANPQWEVKTCETVVFKDNEKMIESEKMVYLESGGMPVLKTRALRLWISSKKDGDLKYQQIGYTNLVPQEIKKGGFFSSPIYEKLHDVINKFNTMNRYQTIPGRILSIVTDDLHINSDSNPDNVNWVESRSHSNRYLTILRVFYDISEPNPEEIEIRDFYPSNTAEGGIFTMPNYEMFCYLVNKVSHWCSQQTDIRICNLQSIDIKTIIGQENLVDSQTMSFTQLGDTTTYYVRIIRVAYVKSVVSSKLYPMLSSPLNVITCKSFLPVPISSGVFMPTFESLQQTKVRVSAWIKATGAQVINAETSLVKVTLVGGGLEFSASTTFNSTDNKQNEHKLYVIRLYLNGLYQEPPPGTMPLVPEIKNSKCLVS